MLCAHALFQPIQSILLFPLLHSIIGFVSSIALLFERVSVYEVLLPPLRLHHVSFQNKHNLWFKQVYLFLIFFFNTSLASSRSTHPDEVGAIGYRRLVGPWRQIFHSPEAAHIPCQSNVASRPRTIAVSGEVKGVPCDILIW